MNQTPEVMDVVRRAGEMMEEQKKTCDLSSFDFASLALMIQKGTLWQIDIKLIHQMDRKGEYHDAQVTGTEGLRPVFLLMCSILDESTTRELGGSWWRLTDESIGLPTSAVILK